MAFCVHNTRSGPAETGRNPVEIQRDPADKPVDSVDDVNACRVCFGNEKNTRLNPCGHVEMCMTCTKTLDGMATEDLPFKCPICKGDVETFCLNTSSDQLPAPES
ncbi:E3 ubiquitin-protein ligase NEURL3-like [Bemisia tabaci]|uniref:E3 ubiquitin-protein ligase NEURL3-like n=1 Tax=Bemisia tabaci TaxID=7038 RepID=UPI003B289CC8